MFAIRIGTLAPMNDFESMAPALNQIGFESYQLTMQLEDAMRPFEEWAERLLPLTEGRPISALGLHGNTLLHVDREDSVYAALVRAIRGAHHLHCGTIGIFAGALPGEPMDAALPRFREVFTPLCKLAEDCGVRLALENCPMGGSRHSATCNIAVNGDMWEKLFDAVPSPALGLEWEPCHAMCQLIDPIPQLRKWAPKVFHVHGKDATIAWDVLRAHGVFGGQPFAWDRTPGYGDTNWCDIMTILLQNGYEGSVDIEGYHDPVFYDDYEWSAQERALRYLKDCRGGQVWMPKLAYNGWRDRLAGE